MTEQCVRHAFYSNRFGDLVCMKCGFRVIRRTDRNRNIWEKDVTVFI